MRNRFLLSVMLGCFLGLGTVSAEAGFWEASAGLNYSRSKYSGGSYSWSRRLGGSLGYNFSDSSTVEIAAQKSFERNHYEGFEDSFYDDQVYSVNFVWNILDKQSVIQPYVKVGVGQLVRNASVHNSTGQSQLQELNQLTGVIGTGFRIYLTKTTALRLEGTSYLSGAKLGTWRDNFGMTFGLSLYF